MTLFEAMEQGKPIDWATFKVCVGCDSILFKSAFKCPICHTYRFEERPDKVEEQAQETLLNIKAGEEKIPRYEF